MIEHVELTGDGHGCRIRESTLALVLVPSSNSNSHLSFGHICRLPL